MTDDVPHTRRHGWIGWTIAGVVVLVVFCLGWVAVRGLGATAALSSAARTTGEVRDLVSAGTSEGLATATKRIAADTANARVLTSDPIWRAVEVVPGLGANLTALREVSASADLLAQDAAPLLTEAASAANLSTMGLTRTRLEVTPLAGVAPKLERAARVAARAERGIRDVRPDALLPPFQGPVGAMQDQIRTVAQATGRLAVAAQVLPSFVGSQTPRHVLVVVQNNAQLRSSGGTPLAFALLRVSRGTVALAKIAGYGAVAAFPSPVAPVSPLTGALFGDAPGLRVQDALSAPEFPEAAALLSRMWTARAGDRVDAVVALDAVALARLLSATGPITAGGVEMTDENAVSVLLGGTADQATPASAANVVAAASQVFAAFAGGTAEPRRTLAALVAAGDEGRVRAWFADPAAQEVLARTTLAGTLPIDQAGDVHVAVLANAAEPGWLGAYADATVSAQLGSCGPDGRTVLRLSVQWTNTLAPDAAAELAASVLGGSEPPGLQRTRLALIGPRGWTADAVADATVEAEDDRRAVRQFDVDTEPGTSRRVTVDFTAPDGSRPRLVTIVTPMIGATPVAVGDLSCG